MPFFETEAEVRDSNSSRRRTCCGGGAAAHEHGTHRRDFASGQGTKRHYAPHFALEPFHLLISLQLDLPRKFVKGEVTTSVRCNSATPTHARSLSFDAAHFDSIDSVVDATPDSKGSSAIETWRYDGKSIHVTWKEVFKKGETRQIRVTYQISHPISGLHFSAPDGPNPNPQRPLFAITDHETERARYWLPCIDNPAVRTTVEFRLRVAQNLSVIAGGVLEKEESHDDGTKTSFWKLTARAPSYLICFAVGDFVRLDDETVEGVPISYFAPASNYTEEHLRVSFGRTPEIMKWMVQKLGNRFPFQKYFQVAAPGIGGAMENISLTTWDDVFVVDELLSKEIQQAWVDSINVHEMSHSYFGDSLVMRHFEHAWLKESWATYMEAVWTEDKLGTDEFHYNLFLCAKHYFGECESYVRPIVTKDYEVSWDLFDNHLYPGGCWRLHMLRRLLSDDVFWPAIQDYIAKYSGQLVDTDDFKKVLERHSSLNLTAFFDEWIFGKGFPRLKGTFSYSAEKKEVKISIEQTQKDDKKGIDLFSIEIDVEVTDEQGNVRKDVVRFDEKGVGSATFDRFSAKPIRVRVDPELKVLFSLEFNPGQDILINTLRHASDVVNRIRSALELIKIGTSPALKAVQEAMREESFWGVRVQVAAALSRQRTSLTVPILAEMLSREQDHRALSSVIMCCKFKDEDIKNALRQLRKRGDITYKARAHALEALGLQVDEADKAALVEATKDRTLRNIVAGGAYKGIGYLRTRESYDILRQALQSPSYSEVPENLRPIVASALASAAEWQPKAVRKDAVEILKELLRSESDPLRRAAVRGLVQLGASEASQSVAALKPQLPNQDQPWLERQLSALRKSPSESATKLRTELEALEARLRKLEEKAKESKSVDGNGTPSSTQAPATNGEGTSATTTTTTPVS